MDSYDSFDLTAELRLIELGGVGDPCFYILVAIVPIQMLADPIVCAQLQRVFEDLVVLEEQLHLVPKKVLGIQVVSGIINVQMGRKPVGPLTLQLSPKGEVVLLQ